jgi:diguanylate cyclase (GGDEF)-like protein/PAS domain S-box-containing protein
MGSVGSGRFDRLRRLRRRLVPLAVWIALVGLFAGVLAWTERSGRRELEHRFALRGVITARFAEAYVADLVDREREQARDFLSGPTVDEESFRRAVAAFGYEAAVLLDEDGRLLHVAPPAPSLIGQNLAHKYAHLRQAVHGQVAVSKAVLSAARQRPIVAFAVPFTTPHGRRVFSGAYEIAHTPLAAYLRNAIPIGSSELYLVDPTGVVVASNRPLPDGLVTLKTQNASLTAALTRQPTGSYQASGTGYYFASQTVTGTPWRLVLTVAKSNLYAPIGGTSRWGPWLVLVAFALGGLLCVALLIQHLESRARRQQLERELSQQRELHERLLHGLSALGEGVVLAEGERIIFANQAYCQLGGYSPEELQHMPSALVLPSPQDRPDAAIDRRQMDEGDLGNVFEGYLRHKSGHALPVEVAVKIIRHGKAIQRLWVARDITERKRWEQQRAELLTQVQALARIDPLTGVANRRVWEEELPREVAKAKRSGQPLCVAILDLDHFKAFNDTYGHQAGDRLLKATASAWQATVRATDLLARYGGEEFALILPNCSRDDAHALADRLRAVMPDSVTVSIGVASWDGQETPDELITRADAALYTAKANGRNRCITA